MSTYTSAATVSRFVKKIGCDGYHDFKIKFVSEIKSTNINDFEEDSDISKRDTIISIVNKVSEIQKKVMKRQGKSFL